MQPGSVSILDDGSVAPASGGLALIIYNAIKAAQSALSPPLDPFVPDPDWG